ncbi:hypothetical protein Dda_1539 [Drechslerella dactyloides]|uniref:Glucose oxidase n=1 Tax=Drechslerella dactyloides TaxID=74499 RepID=A0AAD6J6B4_DREDA|nr:hypothetical protein Dda_1539 [Drechslerella dactyloides]
MLPWFTGLALALLFPPAAHGTSVTDKAAAAAGKTFDYIIVGAGLGGLTVGNKLSGKGFSVLIVEAGPDLSWNPEVFNAEDRVFQSTTCNWQYPVLANNGSKLASTIDSGACIGGSTSINGMVWYRPTKAEVDRLETLGNSGWNWDSLSPNEIMFPTRYKSLRVQASIRPSMAIVAPSTPPFQQAIPFAFNGLTVGNDLSNRTSVVSASTSWTIWYDPVTGKNRRSSAADGLLWSPDQQRDCLTVIANHTVDRVLFSKDMTATGIVFGSKSAAKGKMSRAYAKKGVILSAGTLGSAPILERSGVGNAAVLKAAGVKQLLDLPGVGANLNDQPGTSTSALIAEAFRNDTSLVDSRNLFGPQISLVGIDEIWGTGASIYSNDLISPNALKSRAQALVDAGAAANIAGAEAILNTTISLIVQSRLPVAEVVAESYPSVLSAIFWPLMPLSRGHVHIKSADAFAPPAIMPRLLTDEFDQAVAIAVARRTRDLFSAPPFKDVVADAYLNPPIGPNGTDEEYLAWLSETTSGASHWIGATAMMPRELGGVVDAQLRVYGTKNLLVVDAGILPFQITSHTMSMLYAVARKGAHAIKIPKFIGNDDVFYPGMLRSPTAETTP